MVFDPQMRKKSVRVQKVPGPGNYENHILLPTARVPLAVAPLGTLHIH